MPNISFSNPELIKDYAQLWQTMKVTNPLPAIAQRVNAMMSYKPRYQAVAEKVGCPWYFIACVHAMEAGLNFNKHLHNGDPLTAKTTHVPKGRPAVGTPPFTWEVSAVDALVNCRGLHKVKDWTIERMLFELEGFNGYGYRLYHPDVKSPYLWSFTNHYKRGKYAADGKYDPTLVSQQIGAAILLKELMEKSKQ